MAGATRLVGKPSEQGTDDEDVRRERVACVTGERGRESRSARVPVVASADSWERNNPSALDRFDVAAARRSLLQCLVNPVRVIIVPVRAIADDLMDLTPPCPLQRP